MMRIYQWALTLYSHVWTFCISKRYIMQEDTVKSQQSFWMSNSNENLSIKWVSDFIKQGILDDTRPITFY